MITIDVSIPPALARKLSPQACERALVATLTACARDYQGRIAKYPGRSHSPVIWQSEKQRRYYFAMRREQGLPAKYTRGSDPGSQRLGASWTVERKGRLEWTVGTRVTYARFVQSRAAQQRQHSATGWKTVDRAAEEFVRSGVIARYATAAAKQELG